MKIEAVIACRMGSTRLPGKALLPILEKPMIERMIERIRCSRHINGIMIACTTLPEDSILADLATRTGVGCFRGEKDDVLGRLAAAVETAKADLIVELLGDNPLVHADLIDDVIEFYLSGGYDYAAGVTVEYPCAAKTIKKFPVGIRVQVFSLATLQRCEALAKDARHREHSTSYIYEHPELFRLGYFQADKQWEKLHRPELSFAVNYRKNFELVSQIYSLCYPRDRNFSLMDVINVFDATPALHPLMGN